METKLATRAHLAELFEAAPVAYLALSAEGLILEANRNAAAMLGAARGTLAQRPLAGFVSGPDQDIFHLYRQQFLKTREAYNCELRLVGRDAKPFWAYLTVAAAPGGAGAPPGSLAVLVDITERKRLERDQVRFDSECQQTHRSETIAVLAGGVAHDFNNLLTAILGSATLGILAMDEGTDPVPFFRTIEKAALKAADLTRQLLAYAGKGKYLVAEVELNIAALEIIQILSGTLPPKVTLHCDLAERMPCVKADATQIFQILMNLITNAREAFAPGDGGRITIRTRAEILDAHPPEAGAWVLPAKPGRYASLEVVDTGSGMAPEVAAKAFEPFFTTKFTGRGLGLAAVLGILRAHGGGLMVLSEPGHGSSFKLFLPALPEPGPGSAFELPPAWRGEGRVLLAEGEPEVRSTARRMVEHFGFTVLEAGDGPEAMELFRRHHGELTLALIDLATPGRRGWGAVQAMRKLDPAVPLALSGGWDGTEVDIAAEGLAGYLKKPYRLTEFRGLLQRAMALRCP
jgi:PAS domain S-box-containing protein